MDLYAEEESDAWMQVTVVTKRSLPSVINVISKRVFAFFKCEKKIVMKWNKNEIIVEEQREFENEFLRLKVQKMGNFRSIHIHWIDQISFTHGEIEIMFCSH